MRRNGFLTGCAAGCLAGYLVGLAVGLIVGAVAVYGLTVGLAKHGKVLRVVNQVSERSEAPVRRRTEFAELLDEWALERFGGQRDAGA